MASFVYFITVIIFGIPVTDAFTMSVRPTSIQKGVGSSERRDFVKHVVGASVAAAVGAASSPLVSVAAAREYCHPL